MEKNYKHNINILYPILTIKIKAINTIHHLIK